MHDKGVAAAILAVSELRYQATRHMKLIFDHFANAIHPKAQVCAVIFEDSQNCTQNAPRAAAESVATKIEAGIDSAILAANNPVAASEHFMGLVQANDPSSLRTRKLFTNANYSLVRNLSSDIEIELSLHECLQECPLHSILLNEIHAFSAASNFVFTIAAMIFESIQNEIEEILSSAWVKSRNKLDVIFVNYR